MMWVQLQHVVKPGSTCPAAQSAWPPALMQPDSPQIRPLKHSDAPGSSLSDVPGMQLHRAGQRGQWQRGQRLVTKAADTT